MNEQQQLEEGLAALEMLKKEIESIKHEIEILMVSKDENTRVQEALTALESQETALINIGGDVMLPVRLDDKRAYLDVGSGVVANLTFSECVEHLKERETEIDGIIKKMNERLTEVSRNYEKLGNDVQSMYLRSAQRTK